MPIKYSFIMRNPTDLKDNIARLDPSELADQMTMAMSICSVILNCDDVDEINKPLVEYCTPRFADLLEYAMMLIDAYFKLGGQKEMSKQERTIRKLYKRIKAKQSKIAKHFDTEKIDWKYISTL